MKITNFKFLAVALFIISAIQVGFVSCSDDPGVENYYTSSKEYASDFLQNRSQFSNYVKILQRATGEKGNLRILDLLGTWGQYTVFAPTNDAIDQYLKGKGYTLNELLTVDSLKAECDTIALNSIIEDNAYFITDFSQGTYNNLNMLSRLVSVNTDSAVVDGKVKLEITINETAKMVHYDDSVANGVVHSMGAVVGTSNNVITDVIRNDSTISIFAEALLATGIGDSLYYTKDYSYTVGSDSVDWTNPALVFHTAATSLSGSGGEYDNVAYMKERLIMFTAFVEGDDVYAKYGITNIDELEEYAHKLYDPMYPADAAVTDRTDRRNALNRFVSYHILPFRGTYYNITGVDGDQKDQNTSPSIAKGTARRKIDIADWYETMMPHSIMKLSWPSGTQYGLYVNRRGVQSRPDYRGVFVRGSKILTIGDMEGTDNEGALVTTALNGLYYRVDDIIAYDEQTQKVVLNERMRMDASTLSPDFMTSGARGHYGRSGDKNGKYADSGSNRANSKDPYINPGTCLGFKEGAAKNFYFEDAKTHIHIRPRTINYWSYQGDEMIVKGRFDFTIKLPPVPEGHYEVRMMTCVGFPSRGIMQAFLGSDRYNLTPCGIPFDMRPNGTSLFNNTPDATLGDEDAILAFDKSIHNNGWMKGPGSYNSGNDGWSNINNSFRNYNTTIRKIIGEFDTDGQQDIYLRLQQKMESSENEMNLDFIEIVPSTVYNNEYFAEDKW